MHLGVLVEMIESGFGDRWLIGDATAPVSGAELVARARAGSRSLREVDALVYVGQSHALLPVAVLSAALAGVPFVPVNYRLEDAHLSELVNRQPNALVLTDSASGARVATSARVEALEDWLATATGSSGERAVRHGDEDDVAIVLYTSGTTSSPKAALLRHRHLMAYLLGSVEFGGASETEAALISVPPYHVAGVANMLSNLFAGRRLVYLPRFDARDWLETVRTEKITHAMVVPTMLSRIVDHLGEDEARVPSLRLLSYGGAKVADSVVRRALAAFPTAGFVNAYGLTETTSTVAVLSPEDHRRSIESSDPAVRDRLRSAGRVLPGIELEIRDEQGARLSTGTGTVFVRGPHVSGEYADRSALGQDGWFCTRDRGFVDEAGYLFIEGRDDDTIIRGGENISPAEIESVLLEDPGVAEACVVGVPDDEWGERIAAAVVLRPGHDVEPDALRAHVRSRLRGSKTPDRIVIRASLPHTETGKLLRRTVAAELASTTAQA